MTNLPKEAAKLMDLKQEVECLVSSARRNAEDVKPSVEVWLKMASQTLAATRDIIQEEEEQSKKRGFIRLFPNSVSRRRSSRNASKQIAQILQLQATGREFKEGSVSSSPLTVTFGKDFLHFDSRSKTWEEIMKALKDPYGNVIGVYGLGGLGKTTLVNQVVARAAEEKLFDEVFMPVVTEKNVLDAEEFQEEMAKALNMKLDDQWDHWNVSQRADRIFKWLTGDGKKTIVILDDLRAKLDLEQVGIPFGAGINRCKILFTSRSQAISYASQIDFTLRVLREDEAWWLFQKIAGDILKDQAFLNLGKEITKNCVGLPILIVTVARSLLRRRSLTTWKDALIQLRRQGRTEVQELVVSAVDNSFNHQSHAQKSLLLLCGVLGGGDISIFDQLLKLGIGMGLFKHTKTVEEARNDLETLIHDLKASCLLLDGQSVDSVRMHDVVRDIAIEIASEDHNMVLGSEEWPEDDMLRRCNALTFPYGIVPDLPQSLESSSLKFLLLCHNNSSLRITDNSFEKIQNLTVLDIRSIDLLPTLPSSLALLQNLQTLSLDFCKLRDISIVGALKKLKILSLNSTSIEKLPMEIGELFELSVLDLNGCSELKVIPPGIIQNLSRLEELHMANSFAQWEVEGLQRSNASLDELNCLPDLTTLRIHIPDAKLLPKDFDFKKLERFTILIGDEKWDWRYHDEKSLYRFRGIRIKANNSGNIHLEAGMQEMLKKTEILYLDGVKNIHELEWKSFQELQFIDIQHGAERSHIVNAMEHLTQDRRLWDPAIFRSMQKIGTSDVMEADEIGWEEGCTTDVMPFFSEKVSFPGLAWLKLSGIPHITKIMSHPGVINFKNLTTLTVENCGNMKYLFTHSIAKCLEQVQVIIIKSCESLKEIIALDEGEADETITFPRLIVLDLRDFPCLTRYCYGSSIVFPTLRYLSISECRQLQTFVWADTVREDKIMNEGEVETMDTNEKLNTAMQPQPLFNEMVELPNLKHLILLDLDNVKTIWHNRLHEDSFFKLEQVDISGCPNLLKIFPSTMLTRIQSLQMLYLSNNCLLEEVLGNGEMMEPNISRGGEATEHMIQFPQLSWLGLDGLSNLKRFCSGSSILFPALTKLQILKCKQFETFLCPFGATDDKRVNKREGAKVMQPLFSEKVEFPSLKELELDNLDSIRIIWHNRIHEDPGLLSLKFLAVLEVQNCDGLVSLVPISTAKSLVQLTTLKVTRCKMIKEIVASESADGEENEIVFGELKTLELDELHSLMNFGSRNYVLKFPLLEEVTVTECFNMKAFCGGITVTPKLQKVFLIWGAIKFTEDMNLNTVIEKAWESSVYASSEAQTCESSADLSEEDETYESSSDPSEEDETCEDAEKCSKEVAEMNVEVTNPSPEGETCEKTIHSKNNDGICENIIEPSKEVQTYDSETINSRKVDDEVVELRKEGEFCEEVAEAGNEGSIPPTPDTVDVTGVGATTSQQRNDFQGLQVAQHLVPLLEKARDKYGDFHNSPSIKSKTMRIAAMESVGQVLHILQTQPPRTIDAEKIQFMEEAFRDLSFMSFHVEWLLPLIDRARKCFLRAQKKAKIDEMEAQLLVLKREMETETETALVDLDQPLLDI